MDENRHREDMIQRYLEGLLLGKELEDFHAKVESDREWRIALEVETGLRRIFDEKSVLNFRKEIQDIRNSSETAGNTADDPENTEGAPGPAGGKLITMFKRRGFVYAAAGIALMAAITFLLFSLPGGGDSGSEALFAKYYEPYPTQGEYRSDIDSSPENEAMRYYASGNYSAAAEILETLVKEHPENDLPRFYLAISLIEMEKYEPAEKHFRLLSNEEGMFSGQSAWYLALLQMKTGDEVAAGTTLERISTGKGFKAEEAKKLLRKLNR